MKYVVVLAVVALVALGGAAMAYGESDDSPGMQLIGVVTIAGAVAFGVRRARRRGER